MISSDDDHPPPEPDLQKSNDFKIYSDEKAHASVSDCDLDLFKSLVADLNDSNNPLPNFSIRDYVFNSRSKDIACNWPFSQKTLKICLQHGVKDLLPPFQSLESLRDSSSGQSDEEIDVISDGKPIIDDFASVISYKTNSNPYLKFESTNTTSRRLKKVKEPLTHLQEDLAHTKLKKTSLVSSRKTEEDTIQTTIKKCRLGVKLNMSVETIEETTPNNFIISEAMASKVCPVCKTFSSSSNTTLNAHIDQCLSGESSMKWTANPKVIIKHRIKPRKTRLMVDIYETAPRCTVEELDARNGTSWANNLSFPAQEVEFQGEEEGREKTVDPEVADHEGAVYIDTNGTKVRILSVPKVGTSEDHEAKMLHKRRKFSEVFMEKMKNKKQEKKQQQKYLKLSPNSKKFCSPKPNHVATCQVSSDRGKNKTGDHGAHDKQVSSDREKNKTDDHGAQKLQTKGKFSKFFMEKKENNKHEQKQQQKYFKPSPNKKEVCSPKPNHGAPCEVSSDQEENTGKELMNPEVRKKMNDFPNVRPPWTCFKRTGLVEKVHGNFNFTNNANDKSFSSCATRSPPSLPTKVGTASQHNSHKMGTLPPYKEQPNGEEFSLLVHYAKKRSSLLTKLSSKNLKKEGKGRPLHDVCEDPSDACPSKGFKGSDVRSKGRKFLSSGKKLSSVSRDPSSKFNQKRKFSALSVHPLLKQNVVTVGSCQESLKQQSSAEEESSGKTSSDSMNMSLLEIRKKDVTTIRRLENNVGSNEDAQVMDVAGSSMAVSNSSYPDSMFDSQEHADDTEIYNVDYNEKAMHIDDITDDIKRQQNYFQGVDLIPLPEPPGSFLPSPRRVTVSEDFQRNSSFANISKIQSDEDQHRHDTMDRDSMSESPISTISNPSLARSDSDKLFIRSTSIKDDTTGFSGLMVDAINEKDSFFTSTNAGDQRSVPEFVTENGHTSSFKNDQPCCCSRKEGASTQTIAPSFRQSTLLRKHTAESLNFQPKMLSFSNYPPSPAPPMASPTMKIPAYNECDPAGSPSKPVLRLMGKNLTVADTSSSQQLKPPPQISPMAHFPNISYGPQHPIIFSHGQNGFKSQHPNNSWSSHQLDTMYQSTIDTDRYSHGSPIISLNGNKFDGQMMSERNVHKVPTNPIKEAILIDDSSEDEGNDDMSMKRNLAAFPSSIPSHNHMPSGYQLSRSSLAFSNGSFQTCSPFMEATDNCDLADSSRTLSPSTSHLRSSAISYPPSFS